MSYLLVPTRLDGLFLPKGRHGVQSFADFSRLPWVAQDGGDTYEVNAQDPFLSTTVDSEPLSDTDLWLKPGVHLHWQLPKALGNCPPGCININWQVFLYTKWWYSYYVWRY